MNKCDNCGVVFGDPDVAPMEMDTGYQKITCPYCGGEDFHEVNLCKACGERYTDGDFCEHCMEELDAQLQVTKYDLGVDEETLGEMIAEKYGW